VEKSESFSVEEKKGGIIASKGDAVGDSPDTSSLTKAQHSFTVETESITHNTESNADESLTPTPDTTSSRICT
jgi:hypothetical protein